MEDNRTDRFLTAAPLLVKSACRKLPLGIHSFANLARDWHTPIAVVPVFSGAPDLSPLTADQQLLNLILEKLIAGRPLPHSRYRRKGGYPPAPKRVACGR